MVNEGELIEQFAHQHVDHEGHDSYQDLSAGSSQSQSNDNSSSCFVHHGHGCYVVTLIRQDHLTFRPLVQGIDHPRGMSSTRLQTPILDGPFQPPRSLSI